MTTACRRTASACAGGLQGRAVRRRRICLARPYPRQSVQGD
ncbi:MAG: hypothetical protein OXU61_11230 [Gammaproteobacteria bacterium]|nr:hypothetical protein [Gammaproteobacteria bacterium]